MKTEYSVSEINEYTRRLLSTDPILRNISVSGEISGYKHHYSGHRYFTLKDANARIQCVMFWQNANGLSFEPKDGQKVVVTGSISLYAQTGSYQLYADKIRKSGVGDLYAEFEQLKNRLFAEGLFDPALKKEIPLMPQTIGLVTSATGAAVQDMIRVARRRNPNIQIIISPCAVQGEGAGADVARAIKRIDRTGLCDVLLVGRGGGSIEDLWAFNEEIVARAIAACNTPVISCVGHEVDTTIADYVADLRAATPSAAAELAVPILDEKKKELKELKQRLYSALQAGQLRRREVLENLTSTIILRDPEKYLLSPFRNELSGLSLRADRSIRLCMERKRQRLMQSEALIRGLDPSKVLDRGYAVIRDRRGHVVSQANQVKNSDELSIIMKDGKISANVSKVEVITDGKEESIL